MVASALESGVASRDSVFEVFTRRLPQGRAYGVVAGMNRVIDSIGNFQFSDDVISHLVSSGVVSEGAMTDWLANYRFRGDVTGYADGELFFPYSPVLTVEGSFAECVVLETVLLSVLNHDCAISSAAARVTDAANGRRLIDGGSRRTDPDAAIASARAAHIGGFDTTSNLEAGRRYGIPTGGTTAHAFVLAHATEKLAFEAQLNAMGHGSTYLVDTFDVEQGIRNAVEVVGPGIGGVRIDSGDLLDDARNARKLLDELGATECRIVVSSDLDEFRVTELEEADAPIDAYLVGTRLVTGSGHPTASLVYKLVSIADSDDPDEPMRAVGKLSPGKHTIGGRKEVHRTLDADGYWDAEVLSVLPVDLSETAHHPQVPLIRNGRVVASFELQHARDRCIDRRKRLRPEFRKVSSTSGPAIPTTWTGIERDQEPT
jgi:nicotinate phosphoribosyltransferase